MHANIVATQQDVTQTTLLYHSTQAADAPKPNVQSHLPDHDPDTGPASRSDLYKYKQRKFPFLDSSDSRLRMTDREIIERDIVFKHSILDPDQQRKVKDLLMKHKAALSLHSEVGNTDLTIDFELTDTTPFYIRPFTVSATEKPIIDRELNKLVQMGVLREQHSANSSPVMLMKKKGSKDLRLVTDFRFLNNRIIKRNLPFPLVKEAIQTIGSANPVAISCLDLKEAFHCLNLSRRCQDYCGITSYFGGKSFRYVKLPMGLTVSPSAFQTHINNILDSINAQPYCLAIMDDLILFSKSVEEHYIHVETIL